jgi:hypothetical protein
MKLFCNSQPDTGRAASDECMLFAPGFFHALLCERFFTIALK